MENTNPLQSFRIDHIMNNEVNKLDMYEEDPEIPQALTTLSIKQDVLCISLSRTIVNDIKLLYYVHLKTSLMIDNIEYFLKSAIVHKGRNSNGGHFITYTIEGDSVYCMNDLKVDKTNINPKQEFICLDEREGNGRTCMVFYERKTQEVPVSAGKVTFVPRQMPNLKPRHNQCQDDDDDIIQEDEYNIQVQEEEDNQDQEVDNTHDQEEENNTHIRELSRIIILNNEIKQHLSEVHTPQEFEDVILKMKEEYKECWGSMKNLSFTIPMKDINVVTYGILRGILPTTTKERLCGYPNCSEMVKNNKGREVHWRHKHNMNCPTYNPFAEIMEMFGTDIVSRIDYEEGRQYIRMPLFRCPFKGCEYTSHQHTNMNDHIKHTHATQYKSARLLSPLQRYLWFMQTSNNNQIMEHIIHSGDTMQCKICGWCSTEKRGASKHPAVMHGDMRTEGMEFFRQGYIEYELYKRDGESISPFIGTQEEDSIRYNILQEEDTEGDNKTKRDLLDIISRNDENGNAQAVEEDAIITTQEPIQTNEDQSSDEEEMTEEEINNGIEWHRMFFDEETTLPKYNPKNKRKLTEAMEKVMNDTVIPTLKTAVQKTIPEGAPKEEIINGYISYCFHSIIQEANRALGNIKNNKAQFSKFKVGFDNELKKKTLSRDAGRRISQCIERMQDLRNQQLEEGVLNNREEEVLDQVCSAAESLTPQMKVNLFNTKDLTRERIKNKIQEILEVGSQTNILQYIEHATEEIDEIEGRRRKSHIKKVRELFSISPKRAMRYYVDKEDAPNCNIPIDRIREELARRWMTEDFEVESEDEEKWKVPTSLKEEDKKHVIQSRKTRKHSNK